jgi:hypothetical protein
MKVSLSLLILFSAVLLVPSARALTQEADVPATVEMWEKPYSLSIQDNSFFIEEAFNQEFRVVQHIFSLTRFRQPERELAYSFTQEWPVGGAKHQLSYEIAYATLGSRSEFGDLQLNYRYQLLDKPDGIAFSPRLSLILPTGDELLGFGEWGFEVNLPVSKRLSESFVGHLNAGVTVYPHVKAYYYEETFYDFTRVYRTIPDYFAGASVIYLAHPNLNVMLEWLTSYSGDTDRYGNVVFATSHILSPGLRAALNFDNLQIVPGIAVPVRLHDGISESGIFGYLSFEHGI